MRASHGANAVSTIQDAPASVETGRTEIAQAPGEMTMWKTANHPRSSRLALAFASIVAAVAGPATSQSLTAPSLAATIQSRDLDLTTDAGRRELQHRVRLAAHQLCARSGQDFLPPLARECEGNAIASAAKMQSRVIAQAYGATPAGEVAVTAAAKGP
jgi:UrcA family protein